MSRYSHNRNKRFLTWLKRPKTTLVARFNDNVAIKVTKLFGTMWTCYAFFFYGFMPILFPRGMNQFMYWSTTVQLWSLPLIMVGQSVMGRASEIRAQETYEAVMNELEMVKEDLGYDKQQQTDAADERRELKEEQEEIKQLLHDLAEKNK